MLHQPGPQVGQVTDLAPRPPLHGAGNAGRHPDPHHRGGVGPLEVEVLGQVQGLHRLYGHLHVEGTADLEIGARLGAGVDAPVAAAPGQAGQSVIEAVAVLVEPVVAQGLAAQLESVGQSFQIHAAAPVGHRHLDVVFVTVGGQSHTDPGLQRGQSRGQAVVAELEAGLLALHSLAGEPRKGFGGDVDGDFIFLARIGLQVVVHLVHLIHSSHVCSSFFTFRYT